MSQQRPAQLILGVLALAAASAIGRLEWLIAYADSDDGSVKVLQLEQLPFGPSARRPLTTEPVAALLPRMNALTPEERERIGMALTWYRRALFEGNPSDQFAAAWTGLETLNPSIKAKRGLPQEGAIRKCPKCDADVITAPTSGGIKAAVIASGGDPAWRRANAFRRALVHGTHALSELAPTAPEAARDVLDALRRGLLELLDVPPEELDHFKRSPMAVPDAHRLQVSYRMRPLRADEIPVGENYPRLGLRDAAGTRERGLDGLIHENVRHDWAIRDFSGVVDGPMETLLVTSRDPDDKNAKGEIGQSIISKATGEKVVVEPDSDITGNADTIAEEAASSDGE